MLPPSVSVYATTELSSDVFVCALIVAPTVPTHCIFVAGVRCEMGNPYSQRHRHISCAPGTNSEMCVFLPNVTAAPASSNGVPVTLARVLARTLVYVVAVSK